MTLCPLEHAEPKQQADPFVVCKWHADQASIAVPGLARLHRDLEARLIPASEHAERHGTTTPGLNLDPRVVECRADIVNVTSTWARIVVDEREVEPPANFLPLIGEFLGRHLPWLLSQRFGHQAVLDFTGPWETGKRLLWPNPERIFEVGKCPDCDGTLTARIRPAASLLPNLIACDTDAQHAWTADRWLLLGRRMKESNA
jgi:hypothetical protein